MTIALVSWKDAWYADDDLDQGPSNKKPMDMASVGFVIQNDQAGVKLAMVVDGKGDPLHIEFIPRMNIMRLKILAKT